MKQNKVSSIVPIYMLKKYLKRTFCTFIIGTIVYTLLMSYSFPVLGLPPDYISDTLQKLGWTYLGAPCGEMLRYDTSQFRIPTWTGGSSMILPTDSNKKKTVFFLYFENGCIKLESQFDKSQMKHDTCFVEHYYGSQCDSIWSEEIALQTNNNGEITINTPVDAIVEIYKASKYVYPPIMKFLAIGTGNNQNFQVNLENTVSYVVIFRNSENFIINIKRIGGI